MSASPFRSALRCASSILNSRRAHPLLHQRGGYCARRAVATEGVPTAMVGASSEPGRMRANEDRFFVGRVGEYDLFGVFDGHSGDAAVNYVTTHVLTETEAGLASGADPVDALPGIFQRLADGLYRALTESEELVVDKLRAGTTATLALLSPTRVIVANVGDSRGVLCRGGQAVPLTRQHRPDDPEELDRIMAAGGRVTFVGVPRVDGQLAMTRAIGAFHLADQGVIAEPDVSVHTIDASQDAFLVLGTDGLFDVVRDEEVVATVMACDSVSEAASALSELALAYGTRDNVTAMVVALPAWDELFAMPEVASRNYARRAN